MSEPNQALITGPINAQIRKIAIPSSVGIIFQTIYNVTDTYFGGLISSEALAALSLSFPVFFIIVSAAAGLQTGSTALLANALGAGDREETKAYAAQIFSFAVILAVLLTIVGHLTAPFLFRVLGAEESYLEMSMAYMGPIISGIILFLLNHSFNSILIATGDTKSYRNVLIFGCGLNLILDPWFLFGGFGLPAMGISGVAVATLVVQAVAVAYLYRKALATGLIAFDSLTPFIPKAKYFIGIAKQSVPAALSTSTVALGIFIITYYFAIYGQAAVAAYGIATRVEQIFLMPISGLNTACLTLVAQNNGAGRFDRVRETLFKVQLFGASMMVIGGIITFFFARPLMAAFTDDQAVIDFGVGYLKIAAFILPSYVFLYANVAALQGVKRPTFAVFIGIYRQIAAPILAFHGLAIWLGWGIQGVWWGIFGVTWSAVLVTMIYAKQVLKRIGGTNK